MPIDEGDVPLATVALTFATTPDAIVVSFCPDNTHVTVPEPELQSMVFAAALAAGPAATLTLLIDDGYVNVHSSPDGVEPDEARDNVSEAAPPAAVVPELNANEAF